MKKDYKHPEIINIENGLSGRLSVALSWYRDPVVYRNSEGITDENDIPDVNYLWRMYEYLAYEGEVYVIETLEGDISIQTIL